MKTHSLILLACLASLPLRAATLSAAEPAEATSRPGEQALADYFRSETAAIAGQCLADIKSLDDWTARRSEYRRQLAEMLGLDPMPERTELKPVVTGRHETEWFTVENLHFQSRPGLYVTGNLYLPKGQDKPAPSVLYVCGHSLVKKDGVSYGNKTHYQYHGGWFARNGYVCLIIDTIQLGEIEGLHHGTYREGMWWWNSRGFTPAGVEAFNSIRALDYLQSRPEVDGERLGVTGRSGGGAYSWWLAALDDRVKAAAPVAGITDLENHVVDGCVEGHCDCMFTVNTYRWDYAQVAALVAPRPLLIANSDSDGIFPLDGVERLHAQVRKIYQLHGADDKLGLQISPGPHKDTQELQVAAGRWFNRFLRDDSTATVEQTGISYFSPEELQVFRNGPPSDQINTRVHELFVPRADAPAVQETKTAWEAQRDCWMTALREKCFRGWPQAPGSLNVERVATDEREGQVVETYEFDSQPHVRLRLDLLHVKGAERFSTVRMIVGPADSASAPPVPANATECIVTFLPRGVGESAGKPVTDDDKRRVQVRRRYMLLGQTEAGMGVWDVRRAIEAVRSLESCRASSLNLSAVGEAAPLVVYASLFEPPVASIQIDNPPESQANGPDFLNVLRYLDFPQAVALACERSEVSVRGAAMSEAWQYPLRVSAKLGWGPNRPAIETVDVPAGGAARQKE